MKAFLIFSLLILSALMATAQKWSVEIGTNPLAFFNVPERYNVKNSAEKDGVWYKELRISRAISKQWNVVAFAGHQRRNHIVYEKATTGGVDYINSYGFTRQLVPVGAMAQYHSEAWINRKLGSQRQKWVLRAQAGLYTITGSESYSGPSPGGNHTPINPAPAMGKLNWLATAGIGYKLSKNWQLHAEGGWGALSHCTLHLAYSW
jgi:hypothetical protein